MKGSEWWRDKAPEKLGDAYTLALLEAVRAGAAVIEWQTIIAGDLEFRIMRAPLAIGTLSDHVFALGVSGEAVDMIAQVLADSGIEVMSPTPHLYDLASEHERQCQIGPHTLPTLIGKANGAAGMTKTAAKAHSDAIMLERVANCAFISASCKTTVLHPNMRDGYVCEYGWRLPGKVGWGSRNSSGTGWVVQPAQWAHFYRMFFDYSMGVVFVMAHGRHKGRTVDLRELALIGDPAVAPAGAVPFIIHPDCREPLTAVVEPTEPTPVSRVEPVLSMGSKGAAVARWQRVLMSAGFDLAPYNDDGDFGKLTHNATVGFQHERGLSGTGVVDADTWGAVIIDRDEPDDTITAVVFARNYTKANRDVVDNIVVHTIEIVEASTSADRTAAWFAGKHAPRASAHYCIDDDSTILCVPEEHVAWAAPGLNHNGIQLEHAGYARQTLEQWNDPFSRRMLRRSAAVAAAACKRWDIPAVFVDAAGLMRGERGITTHYQVSRGPGKEKTDHGDPGRHFPMSSYISMIQEVLDNG